jgi:hypothetical protein
MNRKTDPKEMMLAMREVRVSKFNIVQYTIVNFCQQFQQSHLKEALL